MDQETLDKMKAFLEAQEGKAAAAVGISKTQVGLYAAAAVLIIALLGVGYYLYQKNAEKDALLQKAVVMTQEHAANANYWQNAANESKQNADMAAAYVRAAQAGQVAPSVTFVQQSPTVEKAAETVAQRINDGDKTLPPMALERTDRTAVVPQQVVQKDGSKDWQVGIYKVNNRGNWEASGGFGVHGGDKYIPLELQRNFSKDQSLSAEYHFGGKPGYEVKYGVKFDKFLGLF